MSWLPLILVLCVEVTSATHKFPINYPNVPHHQINPYVCSHGHFGHTFASPVHHPNQYPYPHNNHNHNHIKYPYPMHRRRTTTTTTTTTPVPEYDDYYEYDSIPDKTKDYNCSLSSVHPHLNKASQLRPKMTSRQVENERNFDNGVLGFIRSLGFTLSVGQKSGINLRIGQNVEDNEEEQVDEQDVKERIKELKKPTTTAKPLSVTKKPTTTVKPLSVTKKPTPAEDNNSTTVSSLLKSILPSIKLPKSLQHIHPSALIHPRHLESSETLQSRHILMDGRAYLLVPLPEHFEGVNIPQNIGHVNSDSDNPIVVVSPAPNVSTSSGFNSNKIFSPILTKSPTRIETESTTAQYSERSTDVAISSSTESSRLVSDWD